MSRPPVFPVEDKIRVVLSVLSGEMTIAEAGGDVTTSDSHPPNGLHIRLYAFVVLNDFIPLVPVATLLFADTGLGAGAVSSLFLLLTAAALVLEVPAGAWADMASRRQLLALGALLRCGTWCCGRSRRRTRTS
ncbi:hypothetical protein GCM10012275_10440 [Longimycelium tulufanense]|uniref:Uncharacterized protein n=1 Tax=Longimycelium tulufanense TaxID=907463 RepID=A0A8J3CCY7_9PSEU|nr:hypothetical protein [Longimycelium tulufanense]GGM41360.1 hypothetical protein GCM10012275_10440 [Longimycelium tulufanense]